MSAIRFKAVRNGAIAGDPPSPISDLQAYDMDDVRRLLKELLVEGKFSGGVPLKPDLLRARQEDFNNAIDEIETLL
jgi:hypothetical protein